MEATEKNIVYKSNELILGSAKLSAPAQKVFAALVSMVNPKESEPLPSFVMTVKEYSELMNVTRQTVYQSIDSITSELNTAEVKRMKRNSKSYEKFTLLDGCEYDDETKVIRFYFHKALEPHIKDLSKNFTKYQFLQVRRLRSKYAIRIYEILRRHHPITETKNQSVREIQLDDLKAMLGLPANVYSGRFDRFRQYALDMSKKELEEHTDIKFEFKPVRRSRKVTSILFFISHNRKFEPVDEALEGEYESVSNANEQEANPEADAVVLAMLKMQLPKLKPMDIDLITMTYTREIITESLLALSVSEVKTTKHKAFISILAGKLKDSRSDNSTERSYDPYDTSWATDPDPFFSSDD